MIVQCKNSATATVADTVLSAVVPGSYGSYCSFNLMDGKVGSRWGGMAESNMKILQERG